MTIEEALTAYVTNEMADFIDDRFLPAGMGADTLVLGAITYQRIDGPRVRSHSGPSGLAHPRFQLDCYGNRYAQAKEIADVLRSALDGFKGTMSGLRIDSIAVVGDSDLPEPENDRSRISVDVIIWHWEEVNV